MDSQSISIILLAAGASKRMGSTIKQLLPWENTTLLEHAIDQTRPLNAKTYVVLGAHAAEIKSQLSREVDVLVNPNWKNGMGSSIAFAVAEVLRTNPHTKTVLILLADQPLIDSGFFKRLLEGYEKQGIGIAATAYPNKRAGVPAVFDASFFSALLRLNEDKGARELLNTQKENMVTLPIGERGWDIDTIEDYNKLLRFRKEGTTR